MDPFCSRQLTLSPSSAAPQRPELYPLRHRRAGAAELLLLENLHGAYDRERAGSVCVCVLVCVCVCVCVYIYAAHPSCSPKGPRSSRRGRYCAQSLSTVVRISSGFMPLALAASMALSTRMRSRANCSNSCIEISS
jgi:hypothetical protein